MKGLIDFQNAIYKTIGIIIRNDERISLFSNDEKTKYELIFEVKDGSSVVSQFEILRTYKAKQS